MKIILFILLILIILLCFLNKPFIPPTTTTDIKIIETKSRARPIPVPVPVYYQRFPPPAPYLDLAGNYYPEDNPYL